MVWSRSQAPAGREQPGADADLVAGDDPAGEGGAGDAAVAVAGGGGGVLVGVGGLRAHAGRRGRGCSQVVVASSSRRLREPGSRDFGGVGGRGRGEGVQQFRRGGELHALAAVSQVGVGSGWAAEHEQVLEVAVVVVDEELPARRAVAAGGGAGGLGGDGSGAGQGAGLVVEPEQCRERQTQRDAGGERHRPLTEAAGACGGAAGGGREVGRGWAVRAG